MPWGDGFGPWWARGRWWRWGWHGGWHNGWGWRHGPWWADYYDYPDYWYEHDYYPPSKEEERAYLKAQAERLKRDLEHIEERLKELE